MCDESKGEPTLLIALLDPPLSSHKSILMAPRRGRNPSGVHTVRLIHCNTGVAAVGLVYWLLVLLADEDEEDEEDDS